MYLAGDSTLSDVTQFNLPWETLSALIEGKSPIDLTAMPIQDREEAYELVYNYGFDLNLPTDVAEIEGYLIEAINFIEHRFLASHIDWEAAGEAPSPAEKIPVAITQSRDVLDLILIASDKESPFRPWACAVLKVMHTLVYIQNSPLYRYHAQASETILSRFREVIAPEADGSYTLTGRRNRSLNLFGFETKRQKPRESILLKLLCKKENVAEDVWDLVGIRLITHYPAEAILAIDILREQKAIIFSNAIPSRSRNTLVDFDGFRQAYENALEEFKLGKRSLEQMQQIFENPTLLQPEENDFNQNPLSSPLYRSLHITCRQLLRVKAPGALTEARFAFPYEIQIQDKKSYLENREGHSAHSLYKQRQLFAARRRVLGRLLKPATPLKGQDG